MRTLLARRVGGVAGQLGRVGEHEDIEEDWGSSLHHVRRRGLHLLPQRRKFHLLPRQHRGGGGLDHDPPALVMAGSPPRSSASLLLQGAHIAPPGRCNQANTKQREVVALLIIAGEKR